MDDLDVLAREFGLGARGKANPMRPVSAADRRSTGGSFSGGQHKYTPSSNSYGNHKHSEVGDLDYDSIFQSTETKKSNASEKSSSVPVGDNPVYDDDMFDGLPGVKSKSGGPTTRFNDDVFAPPTGMNHSHSSDFDDLLGNLGRDQKIGEKNKSNSANRKMDSEAFDDLLAGFGSDNFNTRNRSVPESRWKSTSAAGSLQGNSQDNPFIVLESDSTPNSSSGRSPDPLEEISKVNKSRSGRVGATSGSGVFDELDPFSTIGKPGNSFSRGKDNGGKDGSFIPATSQSATTNEPLGNSSFGYSKSNMEEKVTGDNFQEPPIFDVPNVSMYFQKSSSQTASSPQYHESPQVDAASTSEGQGHHPEDFWLTISDVPLFTQPTTAPPPSRPPPPIPHQPSRSETRSHSSSFGKKGGEFSSSSSYSQHPQSPNLATPQGNNSPASQFDELEEFAMGRSQNSLDENANFHSGMETNDFSEAAASAAAMKDAMDKAEAKFRHVKEAHEKENARAARNKGFEEVEKDEGEAHVREFRETQVRLEQERKHEEEEGREQRRLERERLQKNETGKARQAVERANREARERAAAEARERATTEARIRAERAAVEKANADARERAERAAVQRAQAEARDRAAAAARGRAEKAAAEAREKELQEKAEAEAKRRAERAAVERAAAETRERAAAQARERSASSARTNQQMNDNDLESFFGMGRASSEPKARSNATDPFFNQQFNGMVGSDASRRTPPSSGTSSTSKKASSATNFVDDLSSIFGAAPSGEFQEVEGESDERRKARLERYQRTQERAAKALDEKFQRDLQSQREQEERRRVAETLDIEIKRWTAGKEGNLRALLSTLQYVLWPESGWQPVSLTDLITAASVKKAYRKATLCVHPDKVQQKGANLQQKYIAEKVFDLLKEAWSKFNSEELF